MSDFQLLRIEELVSVMASTLIGITAAVLIAGRLPEAAIDAIALSALGIVSSLGVLWVMEQAIRSAQSRILEGGYD